MLCVQGVALLTFLAGWTAANIQRFVLDPNFQTYLVDLKAAQVKYRKRYPMKKLLRFCFHRCIGVNTTFEFDVSSEHPEWMSAAEDGEQMRRLSRSSTPPLQLANNNITHLLDMGYNHEVAQQALDAAADNLERALAILVENFK
jgi:hypothetical protein